jgi:hypothetical protein
MQASITGKFLTWLALNAALGIAGAEYSREISDGMAAASGEAALIVEARLYDSDFGPWLAQRGQAPPERPALTAFQDAPPADPPAPAGGGGGHNPWGQSVDALNRVSAALEGAI